MEEITLAEDMCSISAVLKEIAGHFDKDAEYWFRGQSNYKYKLLPSIFRQGPAFNHCAMDEAAMVRDFKRAHPEHRHTHKDHYEWLSLMQHYGLPTRILDWSTNILVALFFATEMNENTKEGRPETDGAVYVLDPVVFEPTGQQFIMIKDDEGIIDAMDTQSLYRHCLHVLVQLSEKGLPQDAHYSFVFQLSAGEEFETKALTTKVFKEIPSIMFDSYPPLDKGHISQVRLKLTRGRSYFEGFGAFFERVPFWLGKGAELALPHLNNRIRAQHGVFTQHGGKYLDGVEVVKFIPPEEQWSDHLIKIKIPATCKQRLIKELAYAGITKSTLFPDLEHVAESIKNKHTTKIC